MLLNLRHENTKETRDLKNKILALQMQMILIKHKTFLNYSGVLLNTNVFLIIKCIQKKRILFHTSMIQFYFKNFSLNKISGWNLIWLRSNFWIIKEILVSGYFHENLSFLSHSYKSLSLLATFTFEDHFRIDK